jgi:amino acid transporter
VSALAEAIRKRQPRTDLGAASPFAGLRRRHAGTIDVVAQSVAATAPAGVLLIHPSALFARSGHLAFLDVLVTATLVVGIALVLGLFARRISSTGSIYTFVTRGLGPRAGLVAGAALALGSLAIALSTLTSGASRVAQLVTSAPDPPMWLIAVFTVGFGAVIAAVLSRGLRMSTRMLLVIETIAVLAVIALSLTALALTGWDLQLLVPTTTTDVSVEAIMAGVSFALIGFVGFESGVALAPETRRPFATVPRALLLSAGAISAVMLVGTAAQLSLVVEDPQGASLVAVTGFGGVVDAIVAVSFLACALAMTNAASRVAFAMSREGLLPPVFGRTSTRGVPAAGALVLTSVVTLIPVVVFALGGTRQELRMLTSPAALIGFALAYALVCLAAPVFLARIGELTWRPVALAAPPFLALIAVLAFFVRQTALDNPLGLVGTLVILGGLTTAGIVRIARDPAVFRRVGMHDSPIDTDCIDAGGRP